MDIFWRSEDLSCRYCIYLVINICKIKIITPDELSVFRKQIRLLVVKIERLSFRCLFSDPLIRGTPGEVMRTCGKKTCKCMQDPKGRHGPYKVISIVQNGKQRSVPLSKDKVGLWELAERYQYQVAKLSELKKVCAELADLVWAVIERRLQQFP